MFIKKWLFKLCNEDGIWQQLIHNKYLKNKTLSQVEKRPRDSHFWSGLMEIKCHFLNLGSFILNNGTHIKFWEDTWLGNQPLKHQYHSLFNIVRNKEATIAEILSSSPLNISFRSVGRQAYRLAKLSPSMPQDIWRTKLPLKIKIFIWYLKKGVLLTKDNLSRRNWHGGKSCAFVVELKQYGTSFLNANMQNLYGE
ncbi:hypothetical protein U9M48_005072 [Paspalum notatum var. saurae]|uniref:Reverse transcriptase zinc-binding domain-containing protein n=1 Tax=Paspalum notatum var. saurae TaxID=547442 RepID=A0AAQ3PWQ0_PASNO